MQVNKIMSVEVDEITGSAYASDMKIHITLQLIQYSHIMINHSVASRVTGIWTSELYRQFISDENNRFGFGC